MNQKTKISFFQVSYTLDASDIAILRILRENCRESYEDIAKQVGLSPNTVKRRISKLVRDNVIERFLVSPSLAMAEAEYVVVFVLRKTRRYDDELMEDMVSYPGVISVGFDNAGSYVIQAEYSDASSLHDMRTFFESLGDGENKVILHPIPVNRGQVFDFTKHHLCVIKSLRENPRLSLQRIAKSTGYSVKKVRRLLDDITNSDAITFSIEVNLQSSKNTVVVLNLLWDTSNSTLKEVTEWLKTEFKENLYTLSFSANQSLVFAFVIMESLNETIPLVQKIGRKESISLDAMGAVFYIKRGKGLREQFLDDLLSSV